MKRLATAGPSPCGRGLDQVIDQYLDSVSLADLQKVEETP